MPIMSVIIPAYNVEAYILDAIQSVLAQTFSYFEILVVDDGSTDGTAAICRTVKDPRLHIISQKNRGLAGARNTGIRNAKGRYLAFLDSDDMWLPNKLEAHLAHLEANPDVGVSYCQSAFVDEAGQFMGYYQTPKLVDISPSDVFLRNPVGNGSAPVIRKEVFEQIRYFDTTYGEQEDFYFDDSFRQSEDIECWVRIALQTEWKFGGIGLPLTLYRVNTGGLSANLGKQLASWERFVEKTRVYAPEFMQQWESFARAFQLRYLARRAVRQGNTAMAFSLLGKAMRTDFRIVLREPGRTICTVVAVAAQAVMPLRAYQRVEQLSMSVLHAARGCFSRQSAPL